MFRLISEKRHNKIVSELINDHTSTVKSLVENGDDLIGQLELCRQENARLSSSNVEYQRKVGDYQSGYQYGLANHRINLSFYYSHNYGNSFDCLVTFTPDLTSFRKRFGWENDGNPIPQDIKVIEQLFKEMDFKSWHWSDTDKKPAAWFGNHDIAAITEAVSKFNGELQQMVNEILTAEQYLRIARATVPEVGPTS